MLSKTKYCNAVQCNKMLWLKKNIPEEASELDQSILDNGKEVGDLAKNLFGPYIDISYNDDLNIMISDTEKLLHLEKVVITEASFVYKDNFCSVDILRKDKENYEIYEVKSSTHLKNNYVDDISYQVYILKSLGYNITKACVVYINNQYERHGDLEISKLFNIGDVTKEALDNFDKVEKKIEEINIYMEQKSEPEQFLGMHCVTPYDCPFFTYCTRHLDKFNVFNISGMKNSEKFKYYNEGKYEYKDLLKEVTVPKYRNQMEYELYDKDDYIDKKQIKEFLDTLSYPLYFLDFETFALPIPKYDETKPFQKIPFQYSLHYIENDKLEHKEFLANPDIDPRRELAETLVKDIPMNVCVLAYNMRFEKEVISNLAELYPDLKKHLMNIHGNMKDLMIPFRDGAYYSKNMHGKYTIKKVLPALFPNDPSLDYHNLDLIHNGSEAMNEFANMSKLEKKEQMYLKERLLKYCELDTYAMVKIWEKLKEKVNN